MTQDGDGPGVYARRQRLHPRGLAVDTQGIGITDMNGVLEPGEAAVVVPAWSNDGATFVALDASVPGLDGPFGPTYTLLDSAANYGSMRPNTLATCNDGNSNPCYAVQISGSRPSTHWDASFQENLSAGGAHRWKLHLGDSFSDVPRSQPFYRKIETLLHNGITSGCTTTQYCPDGVVPARTDGDLRRERNRRNRRFRAEDRDSGRAAVQLQSGRRLAFFGRRADGPRLQAHPLPGRAKRHTRLRADRLLPEPDGHAGRDGLVHREGDRRPGRRKRRVPWPTPIPTASPIPAVPVPPTSTFTDVPASHPFCRHIHYLWARGIVAGCSRHALLPERSGARATKWPSSSPTPSRCSLYGP